MGHRVSRYHDICAGHRVYGHENKCAHLHGHNYRITLVCEAEIDERGHLRDCGLKRMDACECNLKELDSLGRVIDFSVVKATLCQWLEDRWDHKMLLWDQDPWLTILPRTLGELSEEKARERMGIVAVPFNPTAENMAHYLVTVIGPQLLRGKGVYLSECIVEETRKCSASYKL